jgi:hypothetical protein
MANPNQKNYPQMRTNMTTSSPPKNRIRSIILMLAMP